MTLTKRIGLILLATTFALASSAIAETVDIGGSDEHFSGGGDKNPPRCQVQYPTAAASAFFVQWNCTDNDTDRGNIVTEFWLQRQADPVPFMLTSFIGFPASVQINHFLLGVPEEEFTTGLPVAFRVTGRDRAGNTTFTDLVSVQRQDNSVDNCDLTIITDASDSDGGTTGEPASSVFVDNATVSSVQSGTGGEMLRVFTPSKETADPCEISDICSVDSNRVQFDAELAIGETETSGILSIIPGSIVVNVTGTASVSGVVLERLDVTGTTTIDGSNATVTLSCSP